MFLNGKHWKETVEKDLPGLCDPADQSVSISQGMKYTWLHYNIFILKEQNINLSNYTLPANNW